MVPGHDSSSPESAASTSAARASRSPATGTGVDYLETPEQVCVLQGLAGSDHHPNRDVTS